VEGSDAGTRWVNPALNVHLNERFSQRVVLRRTERGMDDPEKVQHQIELAERVASTLGDQTTAQRLIAFANELRQRLQSWQNTRRRRHETGARAYALWEQAGRPSGSDEQFWLQAERELDDKND
jgi:hypothetical protein